MNESRVAALRKGKGWTQERLAAESEIGIRTIQRIESGQDASLETLSLVADALGAEVGELFTTVGSETTKTMIDSFDEEKAVQVRDRRYTARMYLLGFRLVWGIALVSCISVLGYTRAQWPFWITCGVCITALLFGMHTFRTVWLEPGLDKRFPLTRGMDTSTRKGQRNFSNR